MFLLKEMYSVKVTWSSIGVHIELNRSFTFKDGRTMCFI